MRFGFSFTKKIKAGVVIVCALGCFSAAAADIGIYGVLKNNFGGDFKTRRDDVTVEAKSLMMGSGFNFALSVKYTEFNIGVTAGSGTLPAARFENGELLKYDLDWNAVSLDWGVFGKSPSYHFYDRMAFFATAGIENQILFFSVRDSYHLRIEDLKITDSYRWWVKFGGGLDYNLYGRMYFTASALTGIAFTNTAKMLNPFKWHKNIYCNGFDFRAGVSFKYGTVKNLE